MKIFIAFFISVKVCIFNIRDSKAMRILITFLYICCVTNLFAQSNSMPVEICELESLPIPVKQKDAFTLLQKRFSNLEACANPNDTMVAMTNQGFHHFVQTVDYCFSFHKNLTLSPDMIWVLISQGFMTHVHQNKDSLQHVLLGTHEKIELHVTRDNFDKRTLHNHWENIFSEFRRQIGKHVGNEFVEKLAPIFSTTKNVETAVYYISIMDGMQSFFNYKKTSRCGIPMVYLEGTPQDWELLRKKVEGLRGYNIDWWIDSLIPTLDEFALASKGEVNVDFWKSIYKRDGKSGTPDVTGWINDFFPYIFQEEGQLTANHEPEKPLFTSSFTSGFSSSPFSWAHDGSTYQMRCLGGFVGMTYSKKTDSFRPKISWMILDETK